MDDYGRLHIPGFVGETFEGTGLKDEIDEEARQAVETGMNRKQRRAAAAEGRKAQQIAR